jgi:hypothetical protein
MKNSRRFAFNHLFLRFVTIGALFLVGAIPLAFEEVSLGIILLVIALGFLAFPAIFMPFYYHFDSEGVTFFYLFLTNERYLWKNIASVHENAENGLTHDLLFSGYYQIEAPVEGKHAPYMEGKIRKSPRCKRLLETFYTGRIQGDPAKELRTLAQRRAETEERITKQHLTDEIVPMEREKRAEVRRLVLPLAKEAEELGLSLQTEFLFITPDLREYNSRPHGGYSYTALVKISYPEEIDEARVLCLEAELLRVHLDKKAYIGTPNPTAVKKLNKALGEILTKIRKNGFVYYL